MKHVLTLPNLLSASRVISAVPLYNLYLAGRCSGLVILLSFLFITDLADGMIARQFNMTTKLGKILDMLSDNLLINLMLLLFAFFPLNGSSFSLWLVAISIARSLVTIALSLSGSNYKTGFLGQVNAFAMMYFIVLYVLATGIQEFAWTYGFVKYSLYFFIILRVLHMIRALNKRVKGC